MASDLRFMIPTEYEPSDEFLSLETALSVDGHHERDFCQLRLYHLKHKFLSVDWIRRHLTDGSVTPGQLLSAG